MIDIKAKIRELCKNYLENSVVESFLDKHNASYLYDDFVKDIFSDGDNIDIDDNFSLSIWKFEDNIEYSLLDYSKCTDEDGEPIELNSFVLKNLNQIKNDMFFGRI